MSKKSERSAAVSRVIGMRCLGRSRRSCQKAPLEQRGSAEPSFVVIMTDDQTVGELQVMRRTRGLIANQGVSFDRFITSYSLCCPSRVTFMTGQYAHNHGVRGNGTPIGGFPTFKQRDSLPVWLQAAGYHTICATETARKSSTT